jgi:hypothetical protein
VQTADRATQFDPDPPAPAKRRWVKRPQTTTSLCVLAAVAFAVFGIGSPLLGRTVFAATDEITRSSPYLDAGLAQDQVQNSFVDDTWDSMLPAEMLFADSLRHGDPTAWNPYIVGGTPLSATPNYALFSPLTLPYYVLPARLAPGYAKLFEIAVAIGGCYLFLRRLRLTRAASMVGGIVFASSAFMVMWTNWPQTRVAAMIPWAFWAGERLVQRRTVRDGTLLAATLAVMLLGGFPAVTGFTVATLIPYVVVRLVAEHRGGRPILIAAAIGVGAAVGAVALAAIQLVPFAAFYSTWYVDGRAQRASDHLSITELPTMFAPWVYGGPSPAGSAIPQWYLNRVHNLVEASSYVGAASLVLIVVAVVLAGPARAVLPRATWTFFVASAAAWIAVIYGGVGLGLLQKAPVFSSNFIGRGRSVLGFLLAVLAAVGLDVLLRRATETAMRRAASHARRHARWTLTRKTVWTVVVWGGAAAAVGVLFVLARRTADGPATAATAFSAVPDAPARLAFANVQVLVGIVLLVAAGVCAAVLYGHSRVDTRSARLVRTGATTALLALIVGQALAYVGPAWPRVNPETFFPWTDTQQFLARNLGPDRYVSTRNAMGVGVDTSKRLRTLSGHTFLNANMAALIEAVPNDTFASPTYVRFPAAAATVTSPILDRLAARYLVASPRDRVYGTLHGGHDDGGSATLRPGAPLTADVSAQAPVRAVGVTPLAVPKGDGSIDVVLHDASGRNVAHGHRVLEGMAAGEVFTVPVPQTAECGCTAEITLHAAGPMPIRAGDVATVTAKDDGLRLVYVGSSVIYQRLHALPRVRWASASVVESDQAKRLALLQTGSLASNQVMLSEAGPAAQGTAEVRLITDDPDAITIDVAAHGQGYVVVADALQAGWSASLDGRPARLIPADQGIVAVAVAAGTHRIELRYAAPYHGMGAWISLAALLVGIALFAAGGRRTPRQRTPDLHQSTPPKTGDLA